MKEARRLAEPRIVNLENGAQEDREKDRAERKSSRKERKESHRRLMERAVEAASAFPMV